MNHRFSMKNLKAPKLSKLLYILVLCGSICGLGYYVSENYIKLNIDPEILVKAKYINSRSIPFPAVTICPPFPIKIESLNVSNFFKDLQNGVARNLEDKKTITAFSQVCTRYLYNMESFQNEVIETDNIVDIMNKVSPESEDYFDYCVLSNRTNCRKLFIRSLTCNGNCFTFNLIGYHSIFNPNISADFDGYKRKNITKSWDSSAKFEFHDDDKGTKPSNWTIHKGYLSDDDWVQPQRAAGLQFLTVRTKIKNIQLLNFCETNFNSHRVTLHLPDEIPTYSNVFTTIEADRLKYMRITGEIQKTDESLKKYPPEFRNCYFENEKQLKFLKSYTKLNCELECMTNFTYESCGCVAFWMLRTEDMEVCTFKKFMCYRSIFYKWASSFYTNNDNKRNFPNFPCNCLPTCTRIKYSIINEFSTKNPQKSPNFTLSGIQIVFGDSQILESTNYVTYKLQNFVSDIGGLAGLFLGFSLLSMFELAVKAVEMIKNIIKKPDSVRENKQRREKFFSNSQKRRALKMLKLRRKVTQKNANPDVVVIDLLFGEHIKARN